MTGRVSGGLGGGGYGETGRETGWHGLVSSRPPATPACRFSSLTRSRTSAARCAASPTDGWEDFLFWLASDRKKARRITRLIAGIQRTPFEGIGKPEPLKADLSGYWSRRIDDEHRLVYRADDRK